MAGGSSFHRAVSSPQAHACAVCSAFTTGASSDIPHNQVRYLLASGFVVCSPEYRLSPHVLQSAAHEDVFDSYLYIQRELQGVLREQGNPITLDLERCYSQGGSAGGTSALRLVSLPASSFR